MGLLEELQNEVRSIQADEVERTAELVSQEEFYETHLKSAMLRAYQYLSQIVSSLQIVNPEVSAHYPLDPFVEQGIALQQGDYEFSCDNGHSPRQLDIYCNCHLLQPHRFHVPEKEVVLKHSELLEGYAFPYHRKNQLDELHYMSSATFVLEGPMHVRISVIADIKDRCVYIDLKNLEDQLFNRYRFSPERIDNKLLERLARVLIREEKRLVEVAVCENVRDKLRRQLEEDKRRKEEDLERAYAEIEARKLADKKERFPQRTRQLLGARAHRISQLFSKS